MANYIARVELHDADYDDYETLHAEMEQRGYSRTIVGGDGITYHLPTGTYVMRDTNRTLQDAINRATEAANATRKTSSIIVADWTSAMFRGLTAA
jgi:hypothetical protein